MNYWLEQFQAVEQAAEQQAKKWERLAELRREYPDDAAEEIRKRVLRQCAADIRDAVYGPSDEI